MVKIFFIWGSNIWKVLLWWDSDCLVLGDILVKVFFFEGI